MLTQDGGLLPFEQAVYEANRGRLHEAIEQQSQYPGLGARMSAERGGAPCLQRAAAPAPQPGITTPPSSFGGSPPTTTLSDFCTYRHPEDPPTPSAIQKISHMADAFAGCERDHPQQSQYPGP